MEQFLKVNEAARILRVSPSKIRQWIASSRMEAVNVADYGKRPQWRINPECLTPKPPPKQRIARKIVADKSIDI